VSNWCVIKEYKFDNLNDVTKEWVDEVRSAPLEIRSNHTIVNSINKSNYSMIQVRNGSLIMRALRRNETFYSAFVQSRVARAPSRHKGMFHSIRYFFYALTNRNERQFASSD
jgi:hypothetical protein